MKDGPKVLNGVPSKREFMSTSQRLPDYYHTYQPTYSSSSARSSGARTNSFQGSLGEWLPESSGAFQSTHIEKLAKELLQEQGLSRVRVKGKKDNGTPSMPPSPSDRKSVGGQTMTPSEKHHLDALTPSHSWSQGPEFKHYSRSDSGCGTIHSVSSRSDTKS